MKNSINISVGILSFFYALFIFSYPASFFNDDSLFLARGIENFSVIDFSPHFPGYPFIIILGKIINFFLEDSKYSLFILTSSCGVLLPFAIFLYSKKLFDEKIAFITFLLTLSSAYLVNLSLSMLSESVGLFFFFLGLYLLESNKYRASGIILAISLFSRPSYLILFLVGFLYLYVYKKESIKPLLLYFFITSFFFFLFIFLNDGMIYIYEAKRFTEGHFSLWGRGQNSEITWIDNIFNINNIFYLLIFYSLFKFDRRLVLIYILSVAYLLWIIFAQNPDSLRHLIPLVFLFNIILAKDFYKFKYLLVAFIIFNLFTIFSYKQKVSPIEQIIKTINNSQKIIISNRSIEILRENLKNRVVDHYYIHQAKYISNNFKTYTISTNKPNENKYITFYGRFIGEKVFYLIEK